MRVLDDAADERRTGVALLPLTAGAEPLGVLAVSFAGERALSADDRDYLAAVAALALAR